MAAGDTFGAGCDRAGLFRRAQCADGGAGLPHFAVAHDGEFLGELGRVVFGAASLDDVRGFISGGDAGVKRFKHRQGGFLESRFPVERAALGGLRAVGIHPVHAVLIHEADEALGQFFNGLVERFARRVAVGAEDVVLRFEDAGQAAHEDTAFADEVTVGFVWERGREEVAGTDGNADGETAFLSAAGGVLEHGEAGVDAGAAEEIAADIEAGTFRRDHDDVHILRRNDAGLLVVGDREAVREIERVTGFEIGFDGRPDDALGGVGDEEFDDGAALDGFGHREEGLAGHPAVGDGAVPVAFELWRLADDDLEAVVLHVQRLRRALDAVADDSNGFFFEDLPGFRQREFLAGDDGFFRAAKINECHVCVSFSLVG